MMGKYTIHNSLYKTEEKTIKLKKLKDTTFFVHKCHKLQTRRRPLATISNIYES